MKATCRGRAILFAALLCARVTLAAGTPAPATADPVPAGLAALAASGVPVPESPAEAPGVGAVDPIDTPGLRGLTDPTWSAEGVAYGYHRRGQSPGGLQPSGEELLEDLGIIARHWGLVRVYNADDTSARVLALIREQRLPLKVMLGVWLAGEETDPATGSANRANVRRAIELATGYPDVVLAVCVGNETQVDWSGHRLNPSRLVEYLREVRRSCPVPVTTADDFSYWRTPASRSVAQEVDFLTVHAHPLWNGLAVDTSIGWLDGVWNEVQACHPGRTLVLGETGWATCFDASKLGPGAQGTLMKGEVSEAAQEAFLRELRAWVPQRRATTFLFEAFDEPWKGGGEASGPLEVEKHWGVYHENRTPKPAVRSLADGTRTTEGTPGHSGPGSPGNERH